MRSPSRLKWGAGAVALAIAVSGIAVAYGADPPPNSSDQVGRVKVPIEEQEAAVDFWTPEKIAAAVPGPGELAKQPDPPPADGAAPPADGAAPPADGAAPPPADDGGAGPPRSEERRGGQGG